MTRISKEIVPIDTDSVTKFFEQRGQSFRIDAPYSSVLYQDHDPQLAVQRDQYEKELITPKLRRKTPQRILDIGCGIGRWAENLANDAAVYVGIDISQSFIEIARHRTTSSNAVFLVGGATDLLRADIFSHGPFDLVIMSGIMIYLNDNTLIECMQGLSRVVASRGTIYIREPLALKERFTLANHWSEELKQNYSAIYRSASELEEVFSSTLYMDGFERAAFRPLYSDAKYNNRRETAQHYALLKRA